MLENKFAPEKTVMIQFAKRKFAPVPTLYLNGNPIQQASSTKYLGVILNEKLNWTEHIKSKAKKAKALLFAARRYVGKKFGLRADMIQYIWKTCINPIVLYASHI